MVILFALDPWLFQFCEDINDHQPVVIPRNFLREQGNTPLAKAGEGIAEVKTIRLLEIGLDGQCASLEAFAPIFEGEVEDWLRFGTGKMAKASPPYGKGES